MRPIAVFLLGMAFSVAASASYAVEIETAQGPVAIAQVPQRIAVYDIAAIDTLDRLGVPIAGVPDKVFLPRLEHVRSGAEVVGTLFEPDLEALNALEPDLVIVGGRSSTKLDSVTRVAPAMDMTVYGTDLLTEARARIRSYGELFDRPAEARQAEEQLDTALDEARSAVSGKGTALILMTNGPKISAYGAESRFGWLHRDLGLDSAIQSTAAANHGEAVSFEFVRQADPDWLIVVDRAAAIGSGEQNAKATLDNPLVAETTAWKKGQVVYLPSAEFYIAAGGATATVHVLNAIRDAFAGR